MRYVAKYGNDSQDGSTKSRAFKSVQPAITIQTGGGNNTLVDIYDGEYSEVLQLITVNTKLTGYGKVVFRDPSTNSIFINAGTRGANLDNIEAHEFDVFVEASSNGGIRISQWIDVRFFGNGNSDIIHWNFRQDLPDDRVNPLFLDSCLLTDCGLIHTDVGSFNKSVVRAGKLMIERVESQAFIKDCIIDVNEIEFVRTTGIVPFINCLFSPTTTFTYSDGVNQVAQVDLATFQSANNTYSWGFDLSECQTESPSNTFKDLANDDYKLKPTSLAVGMASDFGNVGKYGIGYDVQAVDAGWSNNNGYTLNGNIYEASDNADIESPTLDLGQNRIIKSISGMISEDWANGLLLNAVGNLSDVPIITGGNQAGLNVVLVEDNVYCSTYSEVITNQRTITSGGSFCFAANNGEIIEAVNGSGDIRGLLDDSGLRTIDVKFWREGETEPASYQRAYVYGDLIVDSDGNTIADPVYTGNNPRYPNLRYIKFKPIATSNNVKS